MLDKDDNAKSNENEDTPSVEGNTANHRDNSANETHETIDDDAPPTDAEALIANQDPGGDSGNENMADEHNINGVETTSTDNKRQTATPPTARLNDDFEHDDPYSYNHPTITNNNNEAKIKQMMRRPTISVKNFGLVHDTSDDGDDDADDDRDRDRNRAEYEDRNGERNRDDLEGGRDCGQQAENCVLENEHHDVDSIAAEEENHIDCDNEIAGPDMPRSQNEHDDDRTTHSFSMPIEPIQTQHAAAATETQSTISSVEIIDLATFAELRRAVASPTNSSITTNASTIYQTERNIPHSSSSASFSISRRPPPSGVVARHMRRAPIEPEEYSDALFAHVRETHQRIRQALLHAPLSDVKDVALLKRKMLEVIQFYTRGCKNQFERVCNSPMLCRRLKRNILRLLDLFKEICYTSNQNPIYLQHISQLIGVYNSLELRLSLNLTRIQKCALIHRLAHIIHKHLMVNDESLAKENILRMFLHMPDMYAARFILEPLFNTFLPEIFTSSKTNEQKELPDKKFIQYIIVLHQWKDMLRGYPLEQVDLINKAQYFMCPSKSLHTNPIYANHLPTIHSRKSAVKDILNNLKFFHDLRNAAICDDSHLDVDDDILLMMDTEEAVSSTVWDFGAAYNAEAKKRTLKIQRRNSALPPIECVDLTAEEDQQHLNAENDVEYNLPWLNTFKTKASDIVHADKAENVICLDSDSEGELFAGSIVDPSESYQDCDDGDFDTEYNTSLDDNDGSNTDDNDSVVDDNNYDDDDRSLPKSGLRVSNDLRTYLAPRSKNSQSASSGAAAAAGIDNGKRLTFKRRPTHLGSPYVRDCDSRREVDFGCGGGLTIDSKMSQAFNVSDNDVPWPSILNSFSVGGKKSKHLATTKSSSSFANEMQADANNGGDSDEDAYANVQPYHSMPSTASSSSQTNMGEVIFSQALPVATRRKSMREEDNSIYNRGLQLGIEKLAANTDYTKCRDGNGQSGSRVQLENQRNVGEGVEMQTRFNIADDKTTNKPVKKQVKFNDKPIGPTRTLPTSTVTKMPIKPAIQLNKIQYNNNQQRSTYDQHSDYNQYPLLRSNSPHPRLAPSPSSSISSTTESLKQMAQQGRRFVDKIHKLYKKPSTELRVPKQKCSSATIIDYDRYRDVIIDANSTTTTETTTQSVNLDNSTISSQLIEQSKDASKRGLVDFYKFIRKCRELNKKLKTRTISQTNRASTTMTTTTTTFCRPKDISSTNNTNYQISNSVECKVKSVVNFNENDDKTMLFVMDKNVDDTKNNNNSREQYAVGGVLECEQKVFENAENITNVSTKTTTIGSSSNLAFSLTHTADEHEHTRKLLSKPKNSINKPMLVSSETTSNKIAAFESKVVASSSDICTTTSKGQQIILEKPNLKEIEGKTGELATTDKKNEDHRKHLVKFELPKLRAKPNKAQKSSFLRAERVTKSELKCNIIVVKSEKSESTEMESQKSDVLKSVQLMVDSVKSENASEEVASNAVGDEMLTIANENVFCSDLINESVVKEKSVKHTRQSTQNANKKQVSRRRNENKIVTEEMSKKQEEKQLKESHTKTDTVTDVMKQNGATLADCDVQQGELENIVHEPMKEVSENLAGITTNLSIEQNLNQKKCDEIIKKPNAHATKQKVVKNVDKSVKKKPLTSRKQQRKETVLAEKAPAIAPETTKEVEIKKEVLYTAPIADVVTSQEIEQSTTQAPDEIVEQVCDDVTQTSANKQSEAINSNMPPLTSRKQQKKSTEKAENPQKTTAKNDEPIKEVVQPWLDTSLRIKLEESIEIQEHIVEDMAEMNDSQKSQDDEGIVPNNDNAFTEFICKNEVDTNATNVPLLQKQQKKRTEKEKSQTSDQPATSCVAYEATEEDNEQVTKASDKIINQSCDVAHSSAFPKKIQVKPFARDSPVTRGQRQKKKRRKNIKKFNDAEPEPMKEVEKWLEKSSKVLADLPIKQEELSEEEIEANKRKLNDNSELQKMPDETVEEAACDLQPPPIADAIVENEVKHITEDVVEPTRKQKRKHMEMEKKVETTRNLRKKKTEKDKTDTSKDAERAKEIENSQKAIPMSQEAVVARPLDDTKAELQASEAAKDIEEQPAADVTESNAIKQNEFTPTTKTTQTSRCQQKKRQADKDPNLKEPARKKQEQDLTETTAQQQAITVNQALQTNETCDETPMIRQVVAEQPSNVPQGEAKKPTEVEVIKETNTKVSRKQKKKNEIEKRESKNKAPTTDVGKGVRDGKTTKLSPQNTLNETATKKIIANNNEEEISKAKQQTEDVPKEAPPIAKRQKGKQKEKTIEDISNEMCSSEPAKTAAAEAIKKIKDAAEKSSSKSQTSHNINATVTDKREKKANKSVEANGQLEKKQEEMQEPSPLIPNSEQLSTEEPPQLSVTNKQVKDITKLHKNLATSKKTLTRNEAKSSRKAEDKQSLEISHSITNLLKKTSKSTKQKSQKVDMGADKRFTNSVIARSEQEPSSTRGNKLLHRKQLESNPEIYLCKRKKPLPELVEVKTIIEEKVQQLSLEENVISNEIIKEVGDFTKTVELESRIDETEARTDETETTNVETEARIDEIEARVGEIESRNDETETRNIETEAQSDEAEARIHETESRTDETETRNVGTEAQSDETEARTDENEAKAVELEPTDVELELNDTEIPTDLNLEERLTTKQTNLNEAERLFQTIEESSHYNADIPFNQNNIDDCDKAANKRKKEKKKRKKELKEIICCKRISIIEEMHAAANEERLPSVEQLPNTSDESNKNKSNANTECDNTGDDVNGDSGLVLLIKAVEAINLTENDASTHSSNEADFADNDTVRNFSDGAVEKGNKLPKLHEQLAETTKTLSEADTPSQQSVLESSNAKTIKVKRVHFAPGTKFFDTDEDTTSPASQKTGDCDMSDVTRAGTEKEEEKSLSSITFKEIMPTTKSPPPCDNINFHDEFTHTIEEIPIPTKGEMLQRTHRKTLKAANNTEKINEESSDFTNDDDEPSKHSVDHKDLNSEQIAEETNNDCSAPKVNNASAWFSNETAEEETITSIGSVYFGDDVETTKVDDDSGLTIAEEQWAVINNVNDRATTAQPHEKFGVNEDAKKTDVGNQQPSSKSAIKLRLAKTPTPPGSSNAEKNSSFTPPIDEAVKSLESQFGDVSYRPITRKLSAALNQTLQMETDNAMLEPIKPLLYGRARKSRAKSVDESILSKRRKFAHTGKASSFEEGGSGGGSDLEFSMATRMQMDMERGKALEDAWKEKNVKLKEVKEAPEEQTAEQQTAATQYSNKESKELTEQKAGKCAKTGKSKKEPQTMKRSTSDAALLDHADKDQTNDNLTTANHENGKEAPAAKNEGEEDENLTTSKNEQMALSVVDEEQTSQNNKELSSKNAIKYNKNAEEKTPITTQANQKVLLATNDKSDHKEISGNEEEQQQNLEKFSHTNNFYNKEEIKPTTQDHATCALSDVSEDKPNDELACVDYNAKNFNIPAINTSSLDVEHVAPPETNEEEESQQNGTHQREYNSSSELAFDDDNDASSTVPLSEYEPMESARDNRKIEANQSTEILMRATCVAGYEHTIDSPVEAAVVDDFFDKTVVEADSSDEKLSAEPYESCETPPRAEHHLTQSYTGNKNPLPNTSDYCSSSSAAAFIYSDMSSASSSINRSASGTSEITDLSKNEPTSLKVVQSEEQVAELLANTSSSTQDLSLLCFDHDALISNDTLLSELIMDIMTTPNLEHNYATSPVEKLIKRNADAAFDEKQIKDASIKDLLYERQQKNNSITGAISQEQKVAEANNTYANATPLKVSSLKVSIPLANIKRLAEMTKKAASKDWYLAEQPTTSKAALRALQGNVSNLKTENFPSTPKKVAEKLDAEDADKEFNKFAEVTVNETSTTEPDAREVECNSPLSVPTKKRRKINDDGMAQEFIADVAMLSSEDDDDYDVSDNVINNACAKLDTLFQKLESEFAKIEAERLANNKQKLDNERVQAADNDEQMVDTNDKQTDNQLDQHEKQTDNQLDQHDKQTDNQLDQVIAEETTNMKECTNEMVESFPSLTTTTRVSSAVVVANTMPSSTSTFSKCLPSSSSAKSGTLSTRGFDMPSLTDSDFDIIEPDTTNNTNINNNRAACIGDLTRMNDNSFVGKEATIKSPSSATTRLRSPSKQRFKSKANLFDELIMPPPLPAKIAVRRMSITTKTYHNQTNTEAQLTATKRCNNDDDTNTNKQQQNKEETIESSSTNCKQRIVVRESEEATDNMDEEDSVVSTTTTIANEIQTPTDLLTLVPPIKETTTISETTSIFSYPEIEPLDTRPSSSKAIIESSTKCNKTQNIKVNTLNDATVPTSSSIVDSCTPSTSQRAAATHANDVEKLRTITPYNNSLTCTATTSTSSATSLSSTLQQQHSKPHYVGGGAVAVRHVSSPSRAPKPRIQIVTPQRKHQQQRNNSLNNNKSKQGKLPNFMAANTTTTTKFCNTIEFNNKSLTTSELLPPPSTAYTIPSSEKPPTTQHINLLHFQKYIQKLIAFIDVPSIIKSARNLLVDKQALAEAHAAILAQATQIDGDGNEIAQPWLLKDHKDGTISILFDNHECIKLTVRLSKMIKKLSLALSILQDQIEPGMSIRARIQTLLQQLSETAGIFNIKTTQMTTLSSSLSTIPTAVVNPTNMVENAASSASDVGGGGGGVVGDSMLDLNTLNNVVEQTGGGVQTTLQQQQAHLINSNVQIYSNWHEGDDEENINNISSNNNNAAINNAGTLITASITNGDLPLENEDQLMDIDPMPLLADEGTAGYEHAIVCDFDDSLMMLTSPQRFDNPFSEILGGVVDEGNTYDWAGENDVMMNWQPADGEEELAEVEVEAEEVENYVGAEEVAIETDAVELQHRQMDAENVIEEELEPNSVATTNNWPVEVQPWRTTNMLMTQQQSSNAVLQQQQQKLSDAGGSGAAAASMHYCHTAQAADALTATPNAYATTATTLPSNITIDNIKNIQLVAQKFSYSSALASLKQGNSIRLVLTAPLRSTLSGTTKTIPKSPAPLNHNTATVTTTATAATANNNTNDYPYQLQTLPTAVQQQQHNFFENLHLNGSTVESAGGVNAAAAQTITLPNGVKVSARKVSLCEQSAPLIQASMQQQQQQQPQIQYVQAAAGQFNLLPGQKLHAITLAQYVPQTQQQQQFQLLAATPQIYTTIPPAAALSNTITPTTNVNSNTNLQRKRDHPTDAAQTSTCSNTSPYRTIKVRPIALTTAAPASTNATTNATTTANKMLSNTSNTQLIAIPAGLTRYYTLIDNLHEKQAAVAMQQQQNSAIIVTSQSPSTLPQQQQQQQLQHRLIFTNSAGTESTISNVNRTNTTPPTQPNTLTSPSWKDGHA